MRIEDALAATKAAVEEGIVAGGGATYIHAIKYVAELINTLEGDEKSGAQIVLEALKAPLCQIAKNAGFEGAVIVNKVQESSDEIGFNALTGEYVNMIQAGIIDPTKVTRSALQNAESVASTCLTTEAIVVDKKEENNQAMPNPGAMNGMGMM